MLKSQRNIFIGLVVFVVFTIWLLGSILTPFLIGAGGAYTHRLLSVRARFLAALAGTATGPRVPRTNKNTVTDVQEDGTWVLLQESGS